MTLHKRIINKRGFYEGGKRTVVNRDFWNATSDFETIASPDRDTMRARARWLHENNPIMSNIDRSIINNVIGTGVKVRYLGHTETANDTISKLFDEWAADRKRCDITNRFTFYDMQRIFLQSRMVDGEVFVHKVTTPEGLRLRILEADALDYGEDGGVEKDSYGSPVYYRFKTEGNETVRIPADEIINYYRAERPSQYRGVSEYKQAILDIKNFSAFQTATIEAARARANIGYVVETAESHSSFGVTTSSEEEVQEIGGVTVSYMKPGEKVTKLDPSNAGADFGHFSETVIRLIATARGVSYELAFKDFSRVNYASSRASLLQDYKRFDYEQAHLAEYVLNEVFEAWLEIEVMAGRVKLPAVRFFTDRAKFLNYKWVWPKRDWVDPLKDISAIEKEIALGITTTTDIAAGRGEDFKQNVSVKAEENKILEEYGVALGTISEQISVNDEGEVTSIDGVQNP